MMFACFLLSGCVKEYDRFTAYPPTGDISDFFEAIPTTAENKQLFLAENGTVIVTDNRTLIRIPSNALVDLSGNLIQGEVTFSYKELHTMSELILNNVPTVSDGRLIASAGVFDFRAFQNDNELNLKDGKKIRVQLPTQDPKEKMELFYGSEGSSTGFNWEEADMDSTIWNNVNLREWEFQDSIQEWFDYGYEFECDQLKWINVDIFVEVPEDQKTSVCVELPEIYNNKNTVVFMVFNDIRSFVNLPGNGDTMKFCEPYGLSPIGYNVTFVTISSLGDDEFHLGVASTTITKDHNQFIVPEAKTISEILAFLKTL